MAETFTSDPQTVICKTMIYINLLDHRVSAPHQ